MPSQVTFTGSLGPGQSVTSKVFPNVIGVNLRILDGVADISYRPNVGDQVKIVSVQISNSATLTDTIASGNHTIAIST